MCCVNWNTTLTVYVICEWTICIAYISSICFIITCIVCIHVDWFNYMRPWIIWLLRESELSECMGFCVRSIHDKQCTRLLLFHKSLLLWMNSNWIFGLSDDLFRAWFLSIQCPWFWHCAVHGSLDHITSKLKVKCVVPPIEARKWEMNQQLTYWWHNFYENINLRRHIITQRNENHLKTFIHKQNKNGWRSMICYCLVLHSTRFVMKSIRSIL